ncbi:nicotinate phosphoribosyltransferase [Frankia sp. CcWB2]
MSTALLTDHYELTMLRAALRSGAADRRVVFEVFTRSLPPGRRFGVFAGTGRLLDALADFRFGPPELAALWAADVIDEVTAQWLADYRFGGDIHGFAEGEPFFAETPVLAVEGTFAETVLLETLVLAILNHDSAIAAAGARMVGAAGDRPCLEMGSRRTHEAAAVAAARAAYLVGFAATSNLEAARAYKVPSVGTSAHAFTLVHPSEAEAFAAQVATLGVGTTLLVDTYDVPAGVAAAVATAGAELGAVRIDSGDLGRVAGAVRAQLDSLGATRTRIIATGDLDEHAIARLGDAPVDGYGVGTSLVTGAGAPTAGFVYKLVEVDGEPVAKRSVGKSTRGGRKRVIRRHDLNGRAVADVIFPSPPGSPPAPDCLSAPSAPSAPSGPSGPGVGPSGSGDALPASLRPPDPARDRDLLRPLVKAGEPVGGLTGPAGTRRAREHHRLALAALPPIAREVGYGPPCLPVVHAEGRP